MNISVYSPLSRCTYIELPCELENSVKDLINIKSNDNRCFLWCHIRHFNRLKTHPQRIKKADKEIINDLDYQGIESLLCLWSRKGLNILSLKTEISDDKCCSDIAKKYEIKVGRVNKLVPNIDYKSKYAVHHENHQLYLSLGMISLIYKGTDSLAYEIWAKDVYEDFRKDWGLFDISDYPLILIQAKVKTLLIVLKKKFKLKVNSVYGKTMKKLRKKINARLVNEAKDYKKYASKPSFVSQTIFSKNFVAVHETKSVLTLDKPVYVGFTVLDLSKLI